jgi:hypothetical protein
MWFATASSKNPRGAGNTIPERYYAKIEVPLADCRVISRSSEKPGYQSPSPSSASMLSIMDPGLYDHDTHPYHYNACIIYECKGNKFYSNIIGKDQKTIEYYLMINKITYLYFLSNSIDHYFFDTSFIPD